MCRVEFFSVQWNTNTMFIIFLRWKLHAVSVSVPSSSSLSPVELRFAGGCGDLLGDHFKGVVPALNCPLWE